MIVLLVSRRCDYNVSYPMSVPSLMKCSSEEEHGPGFNCLHTTVSDISFVTHRVWLNERPPNVPPRNKSQTITSWSVPNTDFLTGHMVWCF